MRGEIEKIMKLKKRLEFIRKTIQNHVGGKFNIKLKDAGKESLRRIMDYLREFLKVFGRSSRM